MSTPSSPSDSGADSDSNSDAANDRPAITSDSNSVLSSTTLSPPSGAFRGMSISQIFGFMDEMISSYPSYSSRGISTSSSASINPVMFKYEIEDHNAVEIVEETPVEIADEAPVEIADEAPASGVTFTGTAGTSSVAVLKYGGETSTTPSGPFPFSFTGLTQSQMEDWIKEIKSSRIPLASSVAATVVEDIYDALDIDSAAMKISQVHEVLTEIPLDVDKVVLKECDEKQLKDLYLEVESKVFTEQYELPFTKLAYCDGKYVGYIVSKVDTKSDGMITLNIIGLGVLEIYRMRGIGRKLLQHVLEVCENVGVDEVKLILAPENVRLIIPFFGKLGFSVTDTLQAGGSVLTREFRG